MTLYKNVNGERIEMSAAEEQALRDEWASGQVPTNSEVNRERDRRLNAGVTVNVAGYGDIPVQGGPGDQINMLALGATAQELIGAGVTAAVVPFRDAANTMHDLTPDQVAEMVRKAKEAASAIYAVSWAMKDGTGDFTGGIPSDFTDDTYWP